jgi:hypothetical protein
MPGKRNDMEGNTADQEMALTQITSAWVIVLSILFWATTPSSGNRSIQFSIRGSLAGDVACVGSKGECAEGTEEDTEMIRAVVPEEFDMRTAHAWRLVVHGLNGGDYPVSYERIGCELASSKRGVPATQVEMIATFGKEGHAQLTMRMVFVPSQTVGDEEKTEDAWRTAA